MTHTPGPWVPVPYGDGNDTVICRDEAGNQRIAFMAIPGSRDEQERRKTWAEIKANARLISASPTMLDALKIAQPHVCSKLCPGGDHHSAECLHITATIAEATDANS